MTRRMTSRPEPAKALARRLVTTRFVREQRDGGVDRFERERFLWNLPFG
jgi:hypothetical protein